MEVRMPARVALKRARIPLAENPRVPGQCKSSQGQPVPKPRPSGVGDGKTVNIPSPPAHDKDPMGGRGALGRGLRRQGRQTPIGDPD